MKIAVDNDGTIEQIEVHPLKIAGGHGDGKRLFIDAIKDDGWHCIRLELDTDDCSSEFAKKWAKWAVDVLNRALKDPRQRRGRDREE